MLGLQSCITGMLGGGDGSAGTEAEASARLTLSVMRALALIISLRSSHDKIHVEHLVIV